MGKGIAVQFLDPDEYRKDEYDIWIIRSAYCDRSSGFGWEIEKIDPNGGNIISNLRPVHWRNKK
jgi:hypothetical protein